MKIIKANKTQRTIGGTVLISIATVCIGYSFLNNQVLGSEGFPLFAFRRFILVDSELSWFDASEMPVQFWMMNAFFGCVILLGALILSGYEGEIKEPIMEKSEDTKTIRWISQSYVHESFVSTCVYQIILLAWIPLGIMMIQDLNYQIVLKLVFWLFIPCTIIELIKAANLPKSLEINPHKVSYQKWLLPPLKYNRNEISGVELNKKKIRINLKEGLHIEISKKYFVEMHISEIIKTINDTNQAVEEIPESSSSSLSSL